VNRKFRHLDVVGLIPAAGHSRRISPIPCSKEIYPIGFRRMPGTKEFRPKVVCHYLIDRMREAGITNIFVVLRQGKWDIPSYLGDGASLGVNLTYNVMESSPGPAFTADHAYPFVRNAVVAFGFPDIIFHTDGAYDRLLAHREKVNADLVLAVFPVDKTFRDDRVTLGRNGRVQAFAVNTVGGRYSKTWLFAVWGPRFTEFVHASVANWRTRRHAPSRKATQQAFTELTFGRIIKDALAQGLNIHGVFFPERSYIDIGTPANMAAALTRYGTLKES